MDILKWLGISDWSSVILDWRKMKITQLLICVKGLMYLKCAPNDKNIKVFGWDTVLADTQYSFTQIILGA